MSALIDAYLVFRIRTGGDRTAFARLYDKHVRPLYRFVYAKVSGREVAEDIVSEVFLDIWRLLSQPGADIKSFRGLLYKIARRKVIDVYRRDRRRPTERLQEAVVTDEGEAATTLSEKELSDRGKGHERTEVQADVALLLRQIKKLKEDYQDVLLLRLVEDLSFPEIAQALDKTHANVRVIYHRATALLKNFIDD
jgi:RNA polymerase sigma-70 factor (ECF subfamily)